jgi:UPF0755 protein
MELLRRLGRYVLGLLLIGVVLATGVGIYAVTALNRPVGQPGPPQTFTIDSGERVPSIAARLESAHLIDSALLFQVMLKLKGADAQIKAGDFQLHPGMTPAEIIEAITESPTAAGERVTIKEGLRVEEIADLLAAADLIDRGRFLDLAQHGTFDYDFLPERPNGGELEGYLFPDTYFFSRHGTDREQKILDMMLTEFGQKLTPDRRQKITAGGHAIHEVLTVASIVEREAQQPDERPIIARVFYNRLANGMPLQADPTTQYALGRPGDWWPLLRLDPNTIDNPYNTYVIPGLPPGPISNPGLASIDAAITPDNNDYLFFVACGGGTHAFARTNDEHERNRARCGNK